ncbi:MAG: hypothetical protein K5931_09285 [Lachnospiraceae bacterium]|nr:hypothetical protein [Lachnospiraceae bacterium]
MRITEFRYFFGSYFWGYQKYQIRRCVDNSVVFTARGRNGVELSVHKSISAEALELLGHVIDRLNIWAWNSFHASDDMVEDGYSFELQVVYENESSINASGYELYPKDYNQGHRGLICLLNRFLEWEVSDGYESG